MSEKSPSLKRFLVCIVTGIVFMLVYGYLRALIYEEMFSLRQEFSLYPLILVVIYGALGGIMLAFYLQRKS